MEREWSVGGAEYIIQEWRNGVEVEWKWRKSVVYDRDLMVKVEEKG